MRIPSPFNAASLAAGRWRDALSDPVRREYAVLVSLALYVLLWTVYGIVAKSSQDLHPDMTEVVAWSRDLSLGYLKHPPFAAWIVWLWFSVFPVADWSYYLLAMLMPATALWIVWWLSEDYLDADKRIVGLALLTIVPFFNFHALKFNVNTVLLPLWAVTTLFFLRSVRTRGAICAAIAGIAAAGCMLGKYWSVFLLAGLALAALIDKHRASYLRSAAPWITIAAGLIALVAHLVWLVGSDFAPFAYAIIVHGEKPFAAVLVSALGYLAGTLAYVALPVIIVLALSRPNIRVLADMVWPHDAERRLAAAAFWAPLLLPVVVAVTARAEINSLWSMPAFSLFPIVLLSSPAIPMRASDTRWVLLGAAAFPIVMLIVSPVAAIRVQYAGSAPGGAQTRLLSHEVDQLWHQLTPHPLRFVGGDADLAYGVITYAADRPRALTHLPQPSAANILENGVVVVCFAEDTNCRAAALARNPAAKLIETDIVRNFMGIAGKPQRYMILIIPPRKE